MFPLIILIVVILDRITKFIVDSNIKLGSTVDFLSGVLDFTYIRNFGAAFSTFQGKQGFLIVFTIIAMTAICVYAWIVRKKAPRTELFALALIVGGGLGNLIDRIAYSYVIDFLNIYFIPIFNVADIAVTCGCALLIFSVMVIEPKMAKKQAEKTEED